MFLEINLFTYSVMLQVIPSVEGSNPGVMVKWEMDVVVDVF